MGGFTGLRPPSHLHTAQLLHDGRQSGQPQLAQLQLAHMPPVACHQHPATSGQPPANATERHLPIKRRARPGGRGPAAGGLEVPCQNCVGSARRFAQALPICSWPRTGGATRNWIVEGLANLVRISMNAHTEHLARRLTNTCDYELLQASSQDRPPATAGSQITADEATERPPRASFRRAASPRTQRGEGCQPVRQGLPPRGLRHFERFCPDPPVSGPSSSSST